MTFYHTFSALPSATHLDHFLLYVCILWVVLPSISTRGWPAFTHSNIEPKRLYEFEYPSFLSFSPIFSLRYPIEQYTTIRLSLGMSDNTESSKSSNPTYLAPGIWLISYSFISLASNKITSSLI